MGVESSAVQITINVTDGNSGTVVSGLERNFQQLGNAGSASGKKIAGGMDEVGRHSLTALDNVRLLRDDIGIRIPRSMEKAIASSQAMMTAINAVGTGLLAVGAIDIGIRVAQGLDDAYNKFLSFSGVVEQYNQELAKAKEQDFTNPRSIETTRLRIDEATEAMKRYQREADMLHEKSRSGVNVLDPIGATYYSAWAHDAQVNAMNAARQRDELARKALPGQRHEENEDRIEIEHSQDRQLQGLAKINAEEQRRLEDIREQARTTREQEGVYGNDVNTRSLWTTGKLSHGDNQVLIARAEAQADRVVQGRQQEQELMQMRQEANEAGLRGSALYERQESDAIERLRFKEVDRTQAASLIREKYHNEEMRRLQDEDQQLQKMRGESAAAGLTGIPKIQQEGANRLNDFYVDKNSPSDPGVRLAMIHELTQKTAREVGAAQQEFADHVDSIVRGVADRSVQGFARIHAEAQRQIEDLRTEYKKQGGSPGDLARGEAGIRQGEADQVVKLQRQNAIETTQIEDEARSKLLNSERDKTAAIAEEYQERVQKYRDALDQQQISQQDFNRRVVAAGEEMQAELQDQARQAREKLAGELRPLMGAHPLQALQELGSKFASEAGAALLQRAAGHFGVSTTAGAGIMDRLAGTHLPGMPEFGAGRTGGISAGAMSIAQAQIYVGSASIMGGPGGGGGGFTPGSYSGGSFSGASSFGSGVPGFGGGTIGAIGGAGSSSLPGVTPGPAAAGPGSSGPRFGGIAGIAQQGYGAASSIANLFHGGGSTAAGGGLAQVQGDSTLFQLDKDGNAITKSTGGFGSSILGGGGITASSAAGMAGAGLGMFSAYKQGGVGGMLSGTMSGAQLGMEVGGPWGAAIGAAAGFALGFFGGQEQARVYDLKQVRPRIANDTTAFNQGSMDYMSAYNDLEGLMTDAKNTTNKMGFAGQRYYQNTIKKELNDAMQNLTREQRAGRSQYGFSQASYATGTDSVPETGLYTLHQDESVLNRSDTSMVRRLVGGMSQMPASSSGFGGDVHLHVHALDTKTAVGWMRENKHSLRSAINESFGENSGGADAGF